MLSTSRAKASRPLGSDLRLSFDAALDHHAIGVCERRTSPPFCRWKETERIIGFGKVADRADVFEADAESLPQRLEHRNDAAQIQLQDDFRHHAVAQAELAGNAFEHGQLHRQCDLDAAAVATRRPDVTLAELHRTTRFATTGIGAGHAVSRKSPRQIARYFP